MPAAVTVPVRPVLTTIPDVELCQVGTWQASTGEVTFTPEDFAAAIDAQSDPAVRDGVIKLGHHTQPKGLEQPTIGRVVNLRTTNDGMTLVGDLVGVPSWLADVIPSAFPSRSIEGCFGLQTATGHTHRFVLEGVALLGVTLPACQTLADIGRLYGVAAAANPNEGTGQRVTIEAVPAPRRVALSVSTEDVRRAWYDQAEGPTSWWWIRELNLDPTELIVDDDEGHLWQVPFTVNGMDVTFGAPAEVRVTYVAASESERPRRGTVTVYASRTESLPEGASMPDLTALRTRLGLADDATDDQVVARAAEVAAEAETALARIAELEATPTPLAPATLPEGIATIDAAQLAELRVAAQRGAEAHTILRTQERERFLHRHVAAGRLAPANTELRASLGREWDRDPEAAERVAASLAVVMPTTALGGDDGSEITSDDAVWASLGLDKNGA